MEETTLLYVGGLGRSGSTLLERALAQLPDVCGLGEVVYLWERGIRNDERCGCGEPFSTCPFWHEVGQRAFGGWDQVDAERVAALGARVDDVKFVPRLMLPDRFGGLRELLTEYLGYYERLYVAAQEVSGCRVVVDSSKITSLAYVLSHSPRIDLRLVHILRDPRAVAYSWTKVVRRHDVEHTEAFMARYSPSYMAMLYAGHHVLLEALRLRGVRSVRVRYEDFADDPLREIRRVAALGDLDIDPEAVSGQVKHTLRLGAVHTVSGNPSRFRTGDIAVTRDEKWRTEMPRRQRGLVTVLTAPVMLAYRYPAALPQRREQNLADVESWPSVAAVLPTHDRPVLMRRALESIRAQDYAGPLETVIVFDKAEPDRSLVSDDPRRPVRVVRNNRTPGLAGARNTGILTSDSDLVAFLDDDDHWKVSKLSRQVMALLAEPDAEFATTAMTIEYEDRSIDRLADKDRVSHRDLLRSRMAMLHSSSFLARRESLLDGVGLVDETIPRSMAEDWDLLLRAAKRRPIAHLDEPLIRVQWGPTSYFADQWQTRNEARLWMLEHHPELATDRRAAGLSYGKLAFGSAMLGRRRETLHWSRKALRADWRQPRTVLALLVACRVVRGQWVVDQLNKRGHGI
ncbi:MAG TPA: glycosyltransferase [Nocardioidaceae bacterium]|nr:glycosyltransferase [Nocardioidaceae bacterium]